MRGPQQSFDKAPAVPEIRESHRGPLYLPRAKETFMAENTVPISDANFETSVVRSSLPVLVVFWAPGCGLCVAIAPVLESLAKEYKGGLPVEKMNGDENASVPATFG